ncbi:MAG: DUF5926 family protein [Micrococcales bacterium]|nr:DUF5926 family protein [Micrococcales bacterium]
MATGDYVARPFEGLPGEPDWIALKELVPAATATVRTTAEHGARDVLVTTALPSAWAALHRTDGVLLLALQTVGGSGDASRDLATALLKAMEAEPGTAIETVGQPTPGPRLQDVLDTSVPFEVTVHSSFEYWLDPTVERTPEVTRALEDADAGIMDSARLTGVDAAYWTRMGAKEYLRWAQTDDEQTVLDGLARLHTRSRREKSELARSSEPIEGVERSDHGARVSAIDGGRFLGYFRSCGLVVPVWELVRGSEPEDVEAAMVDFAPRFTAALADTAPLDANARRARAGLVARQVTLR